MAVLANATSSHKGQRRPTARHNALMVYKHVAESEPPKPGLILLALTGGTRS